MTQRLTNLSIDRVSLVDKGANGRVIALLKRDKEGPMTDPPFSPSWLRKAADWLSGKLEPVAKTATFAEVIAGQELSDALYDSWYTLQDVLWGAIYAYDADGQALSIEAKTALVAQDLDEFKAFLLAQMSSASVAKSDDGTPDQRLLGALVRKVGKKISGSRLERLAAASEALNSVLAEVADVIEVEEADEAEETDVNKAELVEAITEVVTKAQAPLLERLEKIEKGQTVVKVDPAAAAAEDVAADDPVTLDTIAKVMDSVLDRLEKIEGGQAVRKSLAGQDGAGDVKKSAFAGILG